jgi:hypothetical protein
MGAATETTMGWFLRSIGGGTDAVEFDSPEQVFKHISRLSDRESALGHKVVKEDGRVSFFNGFQLIDAVWVEDEEGNKVPIP